MWRINLKTLRDNSVVMRPPVDPYSICTVSGNFLTIAFCNISALFHACDLQVLTPTLFPIKTLGIQNLEYYLGCDLHGLLILCNGTFFISL
jgi:hypothetical protein